MFQMLLKNQRANDSGHTYVAAGMGPNKVYSNENPRLTVTKLMAWSLFPNSFDPQNFLLWGKLFHKLKVSQKRYLTIILLSLIFTRN